MQFSEKFDQIIGWHLPIWVDAPLSEILDLLLLIILQTLLLAPLWTRNLGLCLELGLCKLSLFHSYRSVQLRGLNYIRIARMKIVKNPSLQGWEAWPHAHLNEKLESINICLTSHDLTSKCVCCISKYGYLSDDTKIKFIYCELLE